MNEKPSILIVDDVAVNVTLVKCILSRLPYTLFTANSGQDALNIIAKEKIDLVLLDIMMPGMNGYEVLSNIRSQESTKDLPVVMLSALNMHGDVQKAMDMGANGFISKPVISPKLIEMVKKFV